MQANLSYTSENLSTIYIYMYIYMKARRDWSCYINNMNSIVDNIFAP